MNDNDYENMYNEKSVAPHKLENWGATKIEKVRRHKNWKDETKKCDAADVAPQCGAFSLTAMFWTPVRCPNFLNKPSSD